MRPTLNPYAAVPQAAPLAERYDVVLDALFGFSFKGAPRPPFDAILEVRGWVGGWVRGVLTYK